MLKLFSKRTPHARNAHQIYGSIVTMTRTPALYTRIGVPDTLEKRFELLVLHMYVVLNCLDRRERGARELKQALVDRFFEDTEAVSRQAGVGDLAVPKKMRQLAGVFRNRMETYRQAGKKRDRKAMETLVMDNIFSGDQGKSKESRALATYIAGLEQRLASRPVPWILANIDTIAALESDSRDR